MANSYRQGEHIYAVYETEDEHLATAAEYLAEGLRAGERVFYVAESPAAVNTHPRSSLACTSEIPSFARQPSQ